LLDGLEEWRKQHPHQSRWDNDDVAQWLIEQEHFGLERRILRKELARRLARAQNRKRVRNKQNRSVRVYHAANLPVRGRDAKIIQKTFWAHRLELDASFGHKSFEGRQKQAAGFCRSMFKDAQDLNENNKNLRDNPIQLELDFRWVAEERPKQVVQTIPIDSSHSMKLSKRKPR
jgi:hypothetical protein